MILTSLDFIKVGNVFPPVGDTNRRNKYLINQRRFDGTYAKDRVLIIKDNNSNIRKLPWKVTKLNKFKLYTNKMDNLVFKGDPIIVTGDSSRDREVKRLVERTGWMRSIRKAFKNMEIYGDGPIKTFKDGASAFDPSFGFKVVNPANIDEVLAYVIYEYILDKEGKQIAYVRFEIHKKGQIIEIVFEYNGNKLGENIDYKYNGRSISKDGNVYETGVDEHLVQWLSVDTSNNDVYGASPYDDFADLVFEAERRQTLEMKVIDAHSEPIVIVGVGTLRENEVTGEVEAPEIGGVLEVKQGDVEPKYITWDGKMDSSEKMMDRLFSEIYEITELGKTFMTGEYQGNISDDTINSLVKSAIDRGNRHVWEIYYEVVKSLYVLCRLNDIDVNISDLSIVFQIGQVENIKTITDVLNSRVEKGTMSIKRALQVYDELNEEQAITEFNDILEERRAIDGNITEVDR